MFWAEMLTQSVTGSNILNIKAEYRMDPRSWSVEEFKKKDIRNPVPLADIWRTRLLRQLLDQRREMTICGDDPFEVSKLIESLCTS